MVKKNSVPMADWAPAVSDLGIEGAAAQFQIISYT